MKNNDTLLTVRNIKKYFTLSAGFFSRSSGCVKAVNGIDLNVRRGETLGLVGESGCGKTTLGRLILRLEEPTGGKVIFNGNDILSLDKKPLRNIRRHMQIIFQDPFSSLNPRKTVGWIVSESFRIHRLFSKSERRDKVSELLKVVGLMPEHAYRYPHEFSGGQRQRICIARALALNPELIIADEPVSALDVSIQAQILNLMVTLQSQFNLTYIFISHDLGVVRHISDRVAVMYLGRLVELATSLELYAHPKHPYTEALLSAVPVVNPLNKKKRIALSGDVPSPINPPPGCAFHPRCLYRREICKEQAPEMKAVKPDHFVACFFPRKE